MRKAFYGQVSVGGRTITNLRYADNTTLSGVLMGKGWGGGGGGQLTPKQNSNCFIYIFDTSDLQMLLKWHDFPGFFLTF